MKIESKKLVLMLLMLAAAALGFAMKPVRVLPIAAERIDYEFVIPTKFGAWRLLPAALGGVVNPQTTANLQRLYSQVVTRSYQDTLSGKVVMLSVAYGEEQNKQSQVHLPEICYPAQGFQITSSRNDQLQTSLGSIPVKRLMATFSRRNEPITYWIRLGDSIVRGSLEQKLVTIRQGLAGQVSDGLLFRISTIDDDSEQAYLLQNKFVQELLNAIQPQYRDLLIGNKLASK